MGKGRSYLLGVLCVVVLGGIVWWAFPEPADPVYEGKRLSVWLELYDDTGANLHPNREAHLQADEAVRKIGPDAIPLLLKGIRAHDSSLKIRLLQLASKQEFVKIHYTPDWTLNVEAAMAFEALGARASNAVPELIKCFNNEADSHKKSILGRILKQIDSESAVKAGVK